jgi:DNA polymerase (family X)
VINKPLAELISEMAALLELKQDNPFRIRAYQNAAMAIQSFPEDLGKMSREDILKIAGIGQGIADKIQEFAKTGKVKEHQQLRKQFPEGLLNILQVPGLGPKRARLLFDRLKIDSPTKLKQAAMQGKLRALAGFGEKIEENILKGLAFTQESVKRTLLWEARALMGEIQSGLRDTPGLLEMAPAGSLRRGKETVGDLDVLCTSKNPGAVIERFTKMPVVQRVLAAGKTKSSVLLKNNMQCDLRVVPPESFGAALQYFTGSKEHNVALRERALRMGYTINEYGLFRLSDREQKKPLAGKTEEEIYRKLGLEFIPPELRENRGEIEAAAAKKLPRLVEEKDIKGCFHNHTDESDGAHDLETMVRAARDKGWEWYAVADHSPSLKIAGGLEPARLRKKMAQIKSLGKKVPGLQILCSSEVDILSDGRMDYDDDILKQLDVVVGSVHSGFKQTEEQITGRLLKAMENPHVDCIGHLTGRLIGRREAYALNVEKIIAAAANTGTALEINGQPDRQDMSDVYARSAKSKGAPLAVNTDAHSKEELGFMSVAVTVARRGWVEKDDLLNTKSWPELRKWLESR